MNLSIFYFSLASLVLSPGSGVTQDVPPSATGSALLEQCRRGAPECGAYLQGMLDELIVRRAVCGAPRYDRQRLRQAYLRWAESETYLRDKHMAAGANEALTRAWPCARQIDPGSS